MALVLAVALIPSAAVPPPPTRLEAATSPPAAIRIGYAQSVESLNPFIGIHPASRLLYGLLYDYPFSYDQDGNYVPNVITGASCDTPCMNWTYQVRQGIHWSDGTELTADDVAFTWNYDSQDLFHLWAFEPYFNHVVACTVQTRPECGALVTGTWSVTVYFRRPFSAGKNLFAPILEQAQWSSVSPTAAETSYQNANPIGTGPFIADPNIYSEWLSNGAVPLHVYRNANYHPVGSHTGPANISDIYLYTFADENSLALAFEAGSIDLAQMTIPGLQAVSGLPNIQTQTALQAIQEWNEIGISQIDTVSANGRLNSARFDVNVRQAMAKATNKDYILQTVYLGQGARGTGLMSPITPQWWFDPVSSGDNLTFDVAAANTLLDANGWTGTWSDSTGTYRMNPNPITVGYQTACFQCVNPPNVTKTIPAGTHLEFSLATRPQSVFPEEVNTANYLKQQYRQIGIKINVKLETTEAALSTDVYNGYVEMYIWYWSSDPDPNYMISMESSWTLDYWNDNYWNNATYNHHYLAQLADVDPTSRIADVQAAQRIQYESATYLVYIYPFGEWAMRTDLWQGWGDWSAHPYRQMNAYWGANPLWFDLTCPTCSVPPQNQPPTPPVIAGSSYVSTRTGVNLSFTASTSDADIPPDSLNWTWSWGDGNSTTAGNTTATTITDGHIWTLPGNYTVYVSVSDGHNAPVVSSNQIRVNVTNPPPLPGSIQGTVQDASGNAIGGAQVTAFPGNLVASSGTTGAYAITGIAPGTYSVTAVAPGFMPQTTTGAVVVSNAATVVNFSLESNLGWVAGTTSKFTDGSPIVGALILATVASGTNFGQQKATATDSNGHYNLSLEPGEYWVNASIADYASTGETGVVIARDQTTVVDFVLVSSQATTHPSVSGQTGRPGQPMTVSGAISATGPGNWTLHFGDGTTVAGTISASNTTISQSHTYTYQGTYTIRLFATIGANTQVANATALVDGTPPITSASLVGTAGNAPWYRSSVVVTLSASDAMSGVASTSYRIDAGSWQMYATSFTISGDGNHTVEYRSTDVAGNSAAAGSTQVSIDTTAPTLTILAPTSGMISVAPDVAVSWIDADAASGVASVQLSIDNGTFATVSGTSSVLRGLSEGTHTLTIRVTDVAGNVASRSATFTVHAVAAGILDPLVIGSIAAVLVVVAVAVAALVLRMRRTGPKGPEGAEVQGTDERPPHR